MLDDEVIAAVVPATGDPLGIAILGIAVGLGGGFLRDLLIGVPPATFRDWRYLVAVGAAAPPVSGTLVVGVVTVFFAAYISAVDQVAVRVVEQLNELLR